MKPELPCLIEFRLPIRKLDTRCQRRTNKFVFLCYSHEPPIRPSSSGAVHQSRLLVIRWNRTSDSFYFGQWFKGRIYDHRCDLSPDGERLLYFAANYKPPHFSWTGISRPPFLTALALWLKGDCWGGGGEFVSKHRVRLNHRSGEMKLAESFTLPKAMTVEPFGKHSGWGEDSPIREALLAPTREARFLGSRCGRRCRNRRPRPGGPRCPLRC